MKVEIENVDEIIEKKVDSFKTSTRISVPKKYAGRKIKIIILEGKKWGSPIILLLYLFFCL